MVLCFITPIAHLDNLENWPVCIFHIFQSEFEKENFALNQEKNITTKNI